MIQHNLIPQDLSSSDINLTHKELCVDLTEQLKRDYFLYIKGLCCPRYDQYIFSVEEYLYLYN